MPIHDWTRVEPGLFHHFHHSWIEELQRALNARVLPPDYYAMAEQVTGGFGPDVLTLQGAAPGDEHGGPNGSWSALGPNPGAGGLALAEPKLAPSGETDMEFYRRKAASVTVRHVSDDRVVAIVEVVSPGNKHSQMAIEQFVRKAAFLLDQKIHLMILDLLPPGPRDPNGLHALIWEAIDGRPLPKQERPLTLASYETDETIRAFVVPAAVGDRLTDMPLFLLPRGCVEVPLEETYQAAFDVFPRRWKPRLEG
ncbi:DUF4058 family protein [Tautonia sp. JC769]|uniref:DUF4058 family protein n=1 Tax=Tautonia sp. JC769 TaxID=3232135 RepID=UPI0034585E89